MYLTSEKKAELFAKYGNDAKNTGSAESQIALFTFRINHLTEHLKENRKDFGTERALTALVGKRRRMLDYLKAKDIERYRAIIKELGIRKKKKKKTRKMCIRFRMSFFCVTFHRDRYSTFVLTSLK